MPRPRTHPLRRRRMANGWTIYDLADLSGFSSSYISLVETWDREPSPQAKVVLARLLGVRVREIFPMPPLPADTGVVS